MKIKDILDGSRIITDKNRKAFEEVFYDDYNTYFPEVAADFAIKMFKKLSKEYKKYGYEYTAKKLKKLCFTCINIWKIRSFYKVQRSIEKMRGLRSANDVFEALTLYGAYCVMFDSFSRLYYLELLSFGEYIPEEMMKNITKMKQHIEGLQHQISVCSRSYS